MENDGGEGGSGGYVLHPSYRLCPTCLGSYLLREDRPSHAAGTLLRLARVVPSGKVGGVRSYFGV